MARVTGRRTFWFQTGPLAATGSYRQDRSVGRGSNWNEAGEFLALSNR